MQFKQLLKGLLLLSLLVLPQLSYADWSVAVHAGDRDVRHNDDHRFYRWQEHPRWGQRIHYLPAGYVTVAAGGARYFYYDGLYYTRIGGDYVLVAPPVGVYVSVIPSDFRPVIIRGKTYYTDHGVYYVLTHRHGYRVVAPVGRRQ